MNKKRLDIIGLIIACICIVIAFFVWVVLKKDNSPAFPDGAIVRENVTTITEETESEKQPIKVSDYELVFSSDPKFPEGEIIVSGIIDSAPYGFIRKVVSTVKDSDNYVVKTEPATLTDVFVEAHVTQYIYLSDDDMGELGSPSLNSLAVQGAEAVPLNYTADRQYATALSYAPASNKDVLFDKKISLPLTNGVALDAEARLDAWLEIKIDITPVSKHKSSIDLDFLLHNTADAEINLGSKFESGDGKGSLEKELFSKSIVSNFFIGPVPVVIKNELNASLEGQADMGGSIGVNYALSAETVTGFLYRGKTNEIEEIKEKTFESDGIQWNTVAKAKGQASAGIYMHVVSTLYGLTGIDVSLGIEGSVEGEVAVSPKQSLDGLHYAGSLDLKIGPQIEGSLVVSLPVVDEVLYEKRLFVVTLPPWWERHWESGDAQEQESPEAKPETEAGSVHTYTTRFSEINAITYPTFTFQYPDGWTITTEEVDTNFELVTLTNSRGVTVTFIRMPEDPGGYGRFMRQVEISKVAESSFVPGYIQDADASYLGKFVVAKVKTTGVLFMDTDSDYTPTDGGVSYAVVPETFIGFHSDVRGMQDHMVCAFPYGYMTSFIASAPEGGFTAEELDTVIKILSSFAVK